MEQYIRSMYVRVKFAIVEHHLVICHNLHIHSSIIVLSMSITFSNTLLIDNSSCYTINTCVCFFPSTGNIRLLGEENDTIVMQSHIDGTFKGIRFQQLWSGKKVLTVWMPSTSCACFSTHPNQTGPHMSARHISHRNACIHKIVLALTGEHKYRNLSTHVEWNSSVNV